ISRGDGGSNSRGAYVVFRRTGQGAVAMNWSERDLDLFKSKRQRGTKPPPAKEYHLHCLIGDVLKRWCNRDWRYTHVASGEFRTKATAGRLKRMGVTAGWADFQFFHARGAVCFLELKRRGNDLTDAQEELANFLRGAGHKYLCTDRFDDALNFLRAHAI